MPAAYEELLAFLLAHLTQPVEQHADADGALMMTSGEPGEIIVWLTDSHVSVAEYAVRWHTPSEPTVDPIEIGTVAWNAISEDAALRAVRTLLAAAREARLSKFRVCGICERSMPPEWMHDDGVCQRCAEQAHEVVH